MSLSIQDAAVDAPSSEALVLRDGTLWTWREAAERSAGVAEWLRHRWPDAGPGQRVALVAEDRIGSVLAIWALWQAGWTAVPIHARWSEPERDAYLERLGIEAVLSAKDIEVFEGLRRTEDLPHVEPTDPETLAALVATSGSSGGTKAVALSRRALVASAVASAKRLGWRYGDRWLLSLSMAHVGGLSILSRCLEARRPAALGPAGGFRPAETLGYVEENRISLLSLVPAMLRRCLDESVAPPASLRAVLLGGAAAPESLIADALAKGWPLWLTYGLTEACSQVATGPAGERPGAQLLDGIDARTVDGVLELRGDVLFSGYEPGGPSQAPSDWFRTGDLARLDGGCLEVEGRADDVIVTGGENVHPSEVESALLEHPSVREACVVGVDDERWGQVVAAAVVVKGSVGEVDLDGFLRSRLAGFRVPRRWRFVDELPTRGVGKVDRKGVRNLI